MNPLGMFATGVVILLAVVSNLSGTNRAPAWISPLAAGQAPDCPRTAGIREWHSNKGVFVRGKVALSIEGTASRQSDGTCTQKTTLKVNGPEVSKEMMLQSVRRTRAELAGRLDLDAPNPLREFDLVDISGDGKRALVQRSGSDSWRNDTYRDVDIGLLDLSGPSQAAWFNAWDLMRWKDCDATVEAQGILQDGSIALRVRSSIRSSHPKSNCVNSAELWAVSLKGAAPMRLPDETVVARNGKAEGADWASCKDDPDIAGACFTVRGRLRYFNGSPSLRIWPVGTKRILGVQTETAPSGVMELFGEDAFGTEIYGDFNVCPFAKEKPGVMQMVCIESAEKLIAVHN